jgi:Tol biopolymer transport system component
MIDAMNIALAGRYTVLREIGVGGMSTVYLAEDAKHSRRVAIKVLSRELSSAVGTARFLQEIRIAAQLQHPHILGLIDSGTINDVVFYVMPYVDGQSLRDRITADAPMPVREVMRIAREVVDGLGYAHAQGIIHRDIKPENVMLTGRHALVVDFGIAKPVSMAADGDRLTTVGLTLGTPQYIAPEQAAADPDVDRRADIYAIGIMMYEMLAGQTPFAGMSVQQILHAHITVPPEPLSRHRPDIPPTLERAVMRCLEKDPGQRWQTAEELHDALESLGTDSAPAWRSAVSNVAEVRYRRLVAYALATSLCVVAIAVFLWMRPARDTSGGVIGASTQITADDGLEIQPALSPDGKSIAYAAGSSNVMRIYVRLISGGRAIALSSDSSEVETQPHWSPDGNQLLFIARNSAYVSPALGGSKTIVAPGVAGEGAVRSATWSPDGRTIAVVRGDSLFTQTLDGTAVHFIGTAAVLHSCTWSRDATLLACVSGNLQSMIPGFTFGNLAPSNVVIFPAAGGAAIQVTEGSRSHLSPVWSPQDSRLYMVSNRDGPRDVYSVRISADGKAAGPLARLSTGLNAQSISLSGNGRQLAYSIYTAKANVWSLPIRDTTVSVRAASRLTSGSQIIELLSASQDGRWLVYDSDLSGHSDIYRMSLDTKGDPEVLVHDSLDYFAPDLSPDGREVAYHAFMPNGHRQIFVKNVESRVVERVTNTSGQEGTPHWAPDGTALVAWDQTRRDVGGAYVMRRVSPGVWKRSWRLASGSLPVWSPDGRTIAYVDSGGSVFLIPSDSGAIRRLYAPGGNPGDPQVRTLKFSHDGSLLFLKGADAAAHNGVWSLRVSGGGPRLAIRFDDASRSSDRADFSVDATRFYFTVDDRQSDVWVADLRTP